METKDLALLSPTQITLGYSPEDATSLREILEALRANDAGEIELSDEQMMALGERLAAKVDAYKYIGDAMRWDVKRIAHTAKMFSNAKKAVSNDINRLKKLLAFYMRSKEYPTIPGNDWVADLTTSEAVKIKRGPPTAMDAMSHEQFVTVKYEWNKKALSAALKAGDESAKLIAELQSNYSAKFKVRKAIKAKAKSRRKKDERDSSK